MTAKNVVTCILLSEVCLENQICHGFVHAETHD